MNLSRTEDVQAIRSVIGHAEIRPLVYEGDGDIPVPISGSVFHLLAKEERFADGAVEDRVLGLVSFVPMAPGAWNPHIAVLPEARGAGTEIMREGILWMFENTGCRKIVAYPLAENKAMTRVFEKCGLRREGFSPRSSLWRGEMRDRVLMGLEKENG